MKINKYHRDLPLSHAENVTERQYDSSSEHPTTEQMMLREAIKYLTPKQKKIWELWNYDMLTQDMIADKLGIKQQVVSRHIKRIETRIAKWVKSNMGCYQLIKDEMNRE